MTSSPHADRYARLERLYAISHAIHASLDPAAALDLLVHEAAQLVGATSGSLAMLNPTTGLLDIEAAWNLPEPMRAIKMRVGEGITGWVVQSGQSACVPDVAKDRRYVSVCAEVKSELAVPIRMNGEVRGTLNVDADRLDAFNEADQELLEALAAQAAQVIHNTWLYEQLRARTRLLESLAGVGRALNSALNREETLHVVTREAAGLLGARMASLHMIGNDHLDMLSVHGGGESYRSLPPLPLGESLLGTVVRRQKPIQVENIQTSPQYQHREMARQEGIVSLLSVPLLRNAQCLGTLSVYTDRPHTFSNEEVRVLIALADLSAVALDKAQLYERVVDVEEQLRRNEQLSALGLLAAEVAHEIRNPLAVMKMLFHSLDLRFADGDPRHQDARLITEKIDHLNQMVERIVGFARNAEPHLAETDLNKLVGEVCLLVRHKLSHLAIELNHSLSDELPALHADATQIAQALLNLILNAVDAMPNGGKLAIHTAWDRSAGEIVLQVADSGHGMTAEQQTAALSPLLKTTKPGGTGIGLRIVQRVTHEHHGRMEIQSAPGHGTTITLRFSTD